MRCLIIGGPIALNEMLSDVVETFGHAAAISTSLADAKTRVKISAFDLLIFDHKLPFTAARSIFDAAKALSPNVQQYDLSGKEVGLDQQEIHLPKQLERILNDETVPFHIFAQPLSPDLAWLR